MKQISSLLFVALIFLCLGCGTTKGLNPIALLTSNPWELSSLQGQEVDATKFPSGLPNLYFLDGGKLSGFTGCNNFSGGFSLESNGMQLDPGSITKKACPGTAEEEFISALEKVKSYTVNKEKLILSDGITELMSFAVLKNQ
ncbi:META domain-containing protein [Algoriphagus mannitolivorans]|uniref:META domain-containing protein n=1 Tax=Algoriphagus mannitolivorans TaxID=226504 RepID=UPI00040D55D5|nr:META domain-containing protein [Algoriphagus mannitolivorans]